jgi:hypothetical protein
VGSPLTRFSEQESRVSAPITMGQNQHGALTEPFCKSGVLFCPAFVIHFSKISFSARFTDSLQVPVICLHSFFNLEIFFYFYNRHYYNTLFEKCHEENFIG